jgi:hypothetical protein
MAFIRWFRVVNWAWVVAPFRGTARKASGRKPSRPALWPEPLEGRTLLSAGPAHAALPVEPGDGGSGPAAHVGQPAEAGPGPGRATSQGDEGGGGQPRGDNGPQGGSAVGGREGDDGNGHMAQFPVAFAGDEEAVGRLTGGGQERGHRDVPDVAPPRDRGFAGGEDGPAGSLEASARPAASAAALVRAAGPVGLLGDAGSIDPAGAFDGTDLVALLSSAGAVLNGGFEVGALSGVSLVDGNLSQTQALRQSTTPLLRELLLSAEVPLGGTGDPAAFAQFLDGDGAFLELWDRDQLLFPDSLPKVEELLFPGGLPRTEEMPFPDEAPNLDNSLSGGERPIEVPLFAGPAGKATVLAPAVPEGQEAVASLVPAAGLSSGPALSPPDANRAEVPPVGPHTTAQVSPTEAPAARRDTARAARQRARAEDPLRPYQIALGMLPFLPAFGFTAVTLREKVLAGRRLWQDLRLRRTHGR